MPGKKWTGDELAILEEWYPIEGIHCQARIPDRTTGAIYAMAQRQDLSSPQSQPNDYVVVGDYAEVILTDARNVEVARTKVDLEDLEDLQVCRWSYDRNGYGYARGCPYGYDASPTGLHRFLLSCHDSDLHVDHLNGDGLDNRRANLRTCTLQENLQNRRRASSTKASGLPLGVAVSSGSRYKARVTHEGQAIDLGTFASPEEAHKAYIAKKVELGHYPE